MSINVYLEGDKVRDLEGFIVKPRGEYDKRWEEYELPGISLRYDKGRWFMTLNDPTEPIPAVIANLVEEISSHESIPSIPKREAGIYHHESAIAEVEHGKHGDPRKTSVDIKAKCMKDLLELSRMIKVGSTRPDESYEGEQLGMSRKELEAELARTKEELESARTSERIYERMHRKSEETFHKDRETICDIRSLANELSKATFWTGGKWPYVKKVTVATRINETLDKKSEN